MATDSIKVIDYPCLPVAPRPFWYFGVYLSIGSVVKINGYNYCVHDSQLVSLRFPYKSSRVQVYRNGSLFFDSYDSKLFLALTCFPNVRAFKDCHARSVSFSTCYSFKMLHWSLLEPI